MENVFVLLIVFSGFSLLLATVGWFFEIAIPYLKSIKKALFDAGTSSSAKEINHKHSLTKN